MTLKHNPTKLEDELCFAIYTAQKNYNKFYAKALAQFHLTYPQYITLLVLWEVGKPMMIKELGSRLQLDTGTLTPLLKRMEREGWLERKRGEDDGRKVYINLTFKAKEIESKVKQHLTTCFARLDLSEDEYLSDVARIQNIANQLESQNENE